MNETPYKKEAYAAIVTHMEEKDIAPVAIRSASCTAK
jgi:hypothetical protein